MSADNLTELRVLTFNCWGLKFVSKHRVQRIRAIANALESAQYDIIALQELWVHADYEHIRFKLSKTLPYSKYFYSGALGSGLAIFSRFPIYNTYVQPYALNGSPLDVIGGDWFVGKAAAGALVSHPLLGTLEIINTHFHAQGGEEGPEHLRAHRIANAWELSRLIVRGARQGHYVIAMGDLNSTPQSLPMKVIHRHSNARDAWLSTHPTSMSLSDYVSSPIQAIQERGVTCDSPLNTYTHGKPLGDYAKRFFGKRLDYILYRDPFQNEATHSLDCFSSEVRFQDKPLGSEFSLSDHFAVDAVFKFGPSKASKPSGVDGLDQDGSSYLDAALRALSDQYRQSLATSRSLMTVFGVCILVLIAVVIGSAWLPKPWINPIFLLFAIFVSWLATTFLYVGFIFSRWEIRSLTNTIEELEVAKSQIASRV